MARPLGVAARNLRATASLEIFDYDEAGAPERCAPKRLFSGSAGILVAGHPCIGDKETGGQVAIHPARYFTCRLDPQT